MERELRALLNVALDPQRLTQEAQEALEKARRLLAGHPENWWIVLHPRLHSQPSAPSNPPPPENKTTLTMPFGKHKDRSIAELAIEAPDYLEWLLENVDLRPPLRKAIETALS